MGLSLYFQRLLFSGSIKFKHLFDFSLPSSFQPLHQPPPHLRFRLRPLPHPITSTHRSRCQAPPCDQPPLRRTLCRFPCSALKTLIRIGKLLEEKSQTCITSLTLCSPSSSLVPSFGTFVLRPSVCSRIRAASSSIQRKFGRCDLALSPSKVKWVCFAADLHRLCKLRCFGASVPYAHPGAPLCV